MKLRLIGSKLTMDYDDRYISINNYIYASYTSQEVKRINSSEIIGNLFYLEGDVYGHLKFHSQGLVRSNATDNTLRLISSNEVVATYEGNATGAVACFMTYSYMEHTCFCKEQIPIKNNSITQTKTVLKETNHPKAENKQVQKMVEYKFQPSKEQLPPKKEYSSYKKNDENSSSYNHIPNYTTSSDDGCLSYFFGILGILFVISAICAIPRTWSDMPKYLAEGNTGYITCFSTSVLASIVSILTIVIPKQPNIVITAKTYLGICIAGVLLISLIAVNTGFNPMGNAILDYPIALLGAAVGCFQFALPIAIVTAIICLIIALIKKKNA